VTHVFRPPYLAVRLKGDQVYTDAADIQSYVTRHDDLLPIASLGRKLTQSF
jgi:hypothetical protein